MSKASRLEEDLKDAATVAYAFDPARLALARKLAQLKKKDLADKVNKSAAVITQYELGQTNPSAEAILDCAQALGVDPSFFARGRPQLPITLGDVHFRSLRKTSLQEREHALAEVSLRWELFDFLSGFVKFPIFSEDFAEINRESRGMGRGVREAARHAARTLRDHWEQSAGPIAHLTRHCEARGILIFDLDLKDSSDRIDAFSHWLPDRPVVALAKIGDNPLRLRSNIAHEIGHLILHSEAMPGDVQHEREANIFASEFLIPYDQIEDVLPRRVDIDAYLKLQREWGVSIQMLFYAARDLGIFSEATYRRAMVIISQLGWRKNEPTAQYPTEVPIALKRAYEVASQRGLSIEEMSRSLKLQSAILRRLLGMEDSRPALRLV